MAWKKTNQEIAYSALVHGMEVEIGGDTYRMTEDGDLAIRCTSGVAVYEWLAFNLGGATMGNFYALCERMTDKERVEIVASNTLNMTRGGR